MSRGEWIVCERSGRWAAASRAAIGRSASLPSAVPRIYEVRQLGELKERLESRPDAVVLVEIQRENFGDVLIWLAQTVRENRRARFVALLERGMWESAEWDGASRRRKQTSAIDALVEAGATDVIASTRQLAGLLAVALRHASLGAAERGSLTPQMSIAEWAWASLPWQAE